jgi:hypothetical protein
MCLSWWPASMPRVVESTDFALDQLASINPECRLAALCYIQILYLDELKINHKFS